MPKKSYIIINNRFQVPLINSALRSNEGFTPSTIGLTLNLIWTFAFMPCTGIRCAGFCILSTILKC